MLFRLLTLQVALNSMFLLSDFLIFSLRRHLLEPAFAKKTRYWLGTAGFSLAEVTLALGVVSFSLVGIMALFPAAIKSARDSQYETQAVAIERRILADLQSSTSPTNALLVTGTNLLSTASRLTLNMSNNYTKVIGYNESGESIGTIDSGAFSNAIPVENWVYATKLSLQTNGLPQGLTRVDILVSVPASAPLTNRTQFPFVTILRNQ